MVDEEEDFFQNFFQKTGGLLRDILYRKTSLLSGGDEVMLLDGEKKKNVRRGSLSASIPP
jgi:hypothetical protein